MSELPIHTTKFKGLLSEQTTKSGMVQVVPSSILRNIETLELEDDENEEYILEKEEEWLFTTSNEDIRQFQRTIDKAHQNLEYHMESGLNLDVPEVFSLESPSIRVIANIVKIESAEFYFVEDDDINWEEVED